MGDTLFPVRCFTCGKVIGHFQLTYEGMIEDGYTPKQVMDALGIKRECCRGNVLNPIQLPPNFVTKIEGYESYLHPRVLSDSSGIISRSSREEKLEEVEEDTNANGFLNLEDFGKIVDRVFEAR